MNELSVSQVQTLYALYDWLLNEADPEILENIVTTNGNIFKFIDKDKISCDLYVFEYRYGEWWATDILTGYHYSTSQGKWFSIQ